jgi:Ca-activated chloride channel homolog
MRRGSRSIFALLLTASFVLSLTFERSAHAQSRPQKADPKQGDQKKNDRPTPITEEERRRAEEQKNAIVEDIVERVESNIVNVDAVVFNKKTGQIITGLKQSNFHIFENGVRKDISSFSEPESPITVTLVLEYSKWSEVFGSAQGGRWEPGIYEVVKPIAYFLSRFIKPPHDYASVVAFDMRTTPITDFTNDPNRLRTTAELLFRNRPAFRENNLFDAVKFALVGGRADSVVLEDSESRTAEYGGMVNVRAKRKAIILVASGIDTFSRTNYDQVRRVIQESGVPIYIISTGNLFYKRYEQYLPATDSISGAPGRLTFLQAQNAMNTFAKESGGMHFPMTFESEIPAYLNSINGMLRSQYSMAYDLDDKHEPGKRYKLEVKVDIDGDGKTDEKAYVVQHRPYVSTAKVDTKAPRKK